MLRVISRFNAALAGAFLAAAFAAAPLPVVAQEATHSFNIPAQSLSGALVEYSRQSGMALVVPADLVAGKRAPAVRGPLTAAAALEQLLSGSGLLPQRRPEGGLTLVARRSASHPAAAEPDPESVDIVVTAADFSEVARAYAEAIALTPTSADQYARWNFRLCPSVAGLEPAGAQALIDHIARRAYEVGVRTEQSGCLPNLVIVFASDAGHVAREIVTSRRDLLGYFGGDAVTTAGRDALDEFVDTPRAVRWWHVARTASADGEQLGDEQPRPNPGGVGTLPTPGVYSEATGATPTGGLQAEVVRSLGTRLRRPTRQDLSFALLLVDARRVAGVSPQAVADYLTMAALVQLDADADMSEFSSILNLFTERLPGEPAPVAMTVWDLAYLQGLYGAPAEAASTRQQRTEIARRMAEQIVGD